MLDELETLLALAELGTTARAATRLRVTQSAVSKRLATLEAAVGIKLTEKTGRTLRLTAAGERLLAGATPHLRALRVEVEATRAADTSLVRIAATESLLGAWLPGVLRGLLADHPWLRLELHAHRGPVAAGKVRAGEVDLAVCVAGGEEELSAVPIGEEPMVLVGDPLPVLGEAPVPILSIEPSSFTGAWLARRLPRLPWRLELAARIESYASAVQLSRAGFGAALVPEGVASAMGVPREARVVVPGLARPLVACHRPSAVHRPAVASLLDALPPRVGAALRHLS